MEEQFTCPRGREATTDWQVQRSRESKWNVFGEDRCCNYCGSLHPEDFEKIIDLCISSDGAEAEIEPSTKQYKIYAKRKGTSNAAEGGIKFYTQHAFCTPANQEWRDRIEEKLSRAIPISNRRFEEMLRRRKAELEKSVDDKNNQE